VLLNVVIPAIIVAVSLSVTRTHGYTSQTAYVQLSLYSLRRRLFLVVIAFRYTRRRSVARFLLLIIHHITVGLRFISITA